ncbi:dimethylarginine dimethylaminohydrolase family protein [Albimonas pacifica]|uniref:arginine deiminase n=1 Tax=Albimonas pacifica TaxID=1114924 RepID=A0A1I3EA32_9RHOB|nr:arginine deiminase family protein [Albimonas pacifica]SFH95816.1 N-Dimethylarginine dimethylaminohydrolase [Albimonas pacifica]
MSAITENEWRYNQTIKRFPSEPEPAHEAPDQLERWWGRAWGCTNDVGKLRVVLMHRPGEELLQVDASKKLDFNSYGDEQVGWYWRGDVPPDLPAMQAQHDAYVELLRAEGVEVVFIDRAAKDRMKTCYTRDSVVGIGGGAIVTRLGPRIRRGEELPATRTLASIGCPILRTINGTGVFEGGSFAWLNSKTAVVGVSSRVNEEGAKQVGEVLAAQGVELIRVQLTGYRLHIDGLFVMLTPDLALCNSALLPWWFLEELKARGISIVEVCPDDDGSIINSLAIAPGRVVMPDGVSARTERALRGAGVEILHLPYDQVILGGGGLHCSTAPLIRDEV